MTDELEKSIIGQAGLSLMPQSVVQAMLNDSNFLDQFNLQHATDGTITFANGPSFNTIALFNSVRAFDAGYLEAASLTDQADQAWDVIVTADDGDKRYPELVQGEKRIRYHDGVLLLTTKADRERRFIELADDVGLPQDDRMRWLSVLADRPLTNNEMHELPDDLEDTATGFLRRLEDSLRQGETPVELFVPNSRRYYERLIGGLLDATDPREHAQAGASQCTEARIEWNQEKGLLLSLPLASHPAYSSIIPIDKLSDETLVKVYEFLLDYGDMVSCLAAIELAIPTLGTRPALVDLVRQIADKIRTEDLSDGSDSFSELSHIFIFIDSFISEIGVLRDAPPFYRRAAALAQASLIQRQLHVLGANSHSFRSWINEHFGVRFYVQSLVDMRQEPRWHPELIHAKQLQQEFIGRVFNVATAYRSEVTAAGLAEALLPESEDPEGLAALADMPNPYYPGPLEGSLPPLHALPSDLQDTINQQLSTSEATASSLIAAINVANLFPIERDLMAKIAGILDDSSYQLHDVESPGQLGAVLCGLAVIAAVNRGEQLSNAVKVLIRKYRRDKIHPISIDNCCRILFFAAAAFTELDDWCAYIGKGMEDLAFSDLSKDEARVLHVVIRNACECEPSLWMTIGPAEAALDAFIKS